MHKPTNFFHAIFFTYCQHKGFLFQVSGSLQIGELVTQFHVNCLEFTCVTESTNQLDGLAADLQSAACEATKKAVDAFQLLMAGGRAYPAKKTSRYIQNPCLHFHDLKHHHKNLNIFRCQNFDVPIKLVLDQNLLQFLF